MTKMLIEINIYGNEKTDFQTKIEILTGIVCSGMFGELLKVRLQTNQMILKLLKINCWKWQNSREQMYSKELSSVIIHDDYIRILVWIQKSTKSRFKIEKVIERTKIGYEYNFNLDKNE